MKVLTAMLLLGAAPVDAACSHALALGLDISGSVDENENQMQRDGLATALGTTDVRNALLQTPDAPVRLFVYEWSGPSDQIVILPWTDITDDATLDRLRGKLRAAPRAEAQQTTAIGSALRFGLTALDKQTDCDRKTLDLSADGISNTGPHPLGVGRAHRGFDTIVNALAVLSAPSGNRLGDDDLPGYLEAYVIGGPAAFVETASGYADYAAAMERKLLRELRSLALSQLSQPAPLPHQ